MSEDEKGIYKHGDKLDMFEVILVIVMIGS